VAETESFLKSEVEAWQAFVGGIRRPRGALRPGALPECITTCERQLGCRFPLWLRALYRVSDGQGGADDVGQVGANRFDHRRPEGILCSLGALRPLANLRSMAQDAEYGEEIPPCPGLDASDYILLAVSESEKYVKELWTLVLNPATQRVERLWYSMNRKSIVRRAAMCDGSEVRRIFRDLELHWQLQCAVEADDAGEVLSLVLDQGADARWPEWDTSSNATLLHACCCNPRKARPFAALALLACGADPHCCLENSCWMTGMDAVACAMEFHPHSALETLLLRGRASVEQAWAVWRAGPGESERVRALNELLGM